jgi:hypothetical protein
MHASQHLSPLLYLILVAPIVVPVLLMWHRRASHHVLWCVLALPCLFGAGMFFGLLGMGWDDFGMPVPLWSPVGMLVCLMEVFLIAGYLLVRR